MRIDHPGRCGPRPARALAPRSLQGGHLVRQLDRHQGRAGRGGRERATLRHLNVPANLPLEIAVNGVERWLTSSPA
jgi:hypothetical protein